MTFRTYFPERGDIIHFDCSPSTGHEMAGPHFGLVLSPLAYHKKSGMCIILIGTSKRHDWPYVMEIPKGLIAPTKSNPSGDGYLLCDCVRQIDYRERGAIFVAKVPNEFVESALDDLLTLLDPSLAN